MKINWTVRLKHKPFLVGCFSLILLLTQQIFALFGIDTTIHNEQITDIFNTVLGFLILMGVVTDPTTEGMSDSNKALQYKEPKKGE